MTHDELRKTVIALCAAGQKINAIKVYREATGAGLADAKRDVEALAAGAMPAMPALRAVAPPVGASVGAAASPATLDAVEALLRAGNKIEAIKVYRERTGLGLLEAKNAVEAMAAGTAPYGAAPAAPSPASFGNGLSSSSVPALGRPARASAPAFAPGAAKEPRRRFGSDDLARESEGPSIVLLGGVLVALAAVVLALVYVLYGR